jgi:hypothetical protein
MLYELDTLLQRNYNEIAVKKSPKRYSYLKESLPFSIAA